VRVKTTWLQSNEKETHFKGTELLSAQRGDITARSAVTRRISVFDCELGNQIICGAGILES
jgi:hypothetical protein